MIASDSTVFYIAESFRRNTAIELLAILRWCYNMKSVFEGIQSLVDKLRHVPLRQINPHSTHLNLVLLNASESPPIFIRATALNQARGVAF